jgi:uncharacterized membrane protein YbhN (UPF0104 family)
VINKAKNVAIRAWARLLTAFLSLSPRSKNLLGYAIALSIIAFVTWGISVDEVVKALGRAKLYLFIPARVSSLLCFFFGECLLFSLLFSYFNVRVTFREMLPVNAAQYFLQVINAAVAGGALVAFLHRRKGVPWLAGGCMMIFQALLDIQVMAWIYLAGILLVPSFPLQTAWYYPALVIAGLWVFAGFWMRGQPRSPLLRWLYSRTSFAAFRQARLYHYLILMAIRVPIFLVQCVAFYLQMISFNVHVTLAQVIAATPAIMLLTALPIVPVGLGTDQAVMVYGFHAYGSKADLLSMSLATNAMGILFRLALGLSSAGVFARELTEGVEATEPLAPDTSTSHEPRLKSPSSMKHSSRGGTEDYGEEQGHARALES